MLELQTVVSHVLVVKVYVVRQFLAVAGALLLLLRHLKELGCDCLEVFHQQIVLSVDGLLVALALVADRVSLCVGRVFGL